MNRTRRLCFPTDYCLLLTLLASRFHLRDEGGHVVAVGLLESRRPVGLVGVEPAQVLADAGVAAGELFDESVPTRRERLRLLARRVEPPGRRGRDLGDELLPLALPSLQNLGRAAPREVG